MSQSLEDKKWLLRGNSIEDLQNKEEKSKQISLPKTIETTSKTSTPLASTTTTTTTSSSSSSSSSTSVTMSGTNKLAQEIYDEFLVCKICLESFKNPKCLDCLHTFCEACIDNHVNSEPAYKKYSDYREFTCPLCRKRTQLPVGGVKKLPDNFLISNLGEVVVRQKPPTTPFCDICKLVIKSEKEATSKCLDCNKLLCAPCVALHKNTKVTSGHSLFDVEIEKEIGCKDHQDEVVRFYCEPCQTCVCILCTFNEHREHSISQFQDVASKYKNNIENLLFSCKTKIVILENQLKSITKCESTIKQVEQLIRDKSIECIQEIRAKEKELLEELQQIYGQECFDSIEAKKEMTHQVDNIKNTCNISEVILLGKEIELLLLKKDVEEKLNLMNQIEPRKLPSTIDKVVQFQTGQVDLGYLVHSTPGMKSNSRELVLVKARKTDNGKPTTRWMAATVQNKTGPQKVAEGSSVVVKVTGGGAYEIMETKERGIQTEKVLENKEHQDKKKK